MMYRLLENLLTRASSTWLTPNGKVEPITTPDHATDAWVRLIKLEGEEPDWDLYTGDAAEESFHEFMKITGYIRIYISRYGDALNLSVGSKVTSTQLSKIGKLAREYPNVYWEVTNPLLFSAEESGQGFREFVDTLKEYKLLEKILFEDLYADVNGFINPSGKRITDIYSHEDYAAEYLKKHKIIISSPRYGSKVVAKFQSVTGNIRYMESSDELGFTIVTPVTSAQLRALRTLNKPGQKVVFDVVDEHGENITYGVGFSNLISALEKMDLLEKILRVDEARGHWRNWSEVSCSKCHWRDYRKNFAKRGEKIPEVCPECGTELKLEECVDESFVKESRIDFPREDLDFAIWDKEDNIYTLKEEVKEKILAVLGEYEEDLVDTAKEIHIVGSITSNQYSDDADIDIHIVPKSVEGWDADNIKKLQIWFNDHRDNFDGYVNEHPIEVYVQLNATQDLLSVGNYDILSDRWLVGPVVVPSDYDPYEDFAEVANTVKDVVRDADVLFGELKRDVIDYEVVKSAMKSMSKEDQEKLLQRLQSKLTEIEDTIESLYKERKGYVDIRRTMDAEHALKDVSNMEQWQDADATFKFINRYRYFKTIGDLNDLLADEKVTPDEVDQIKNIMGV